LGKYLTAYMGFFGLFSLSSLAFPGTNSFVGEILVLVGSFQMSYWVGALAIPGALLAAAYMLRLLQKMAWGEPSSVPKWHGARDLNLREWVYLVPLALMVLYLGLAPGLTLRAVDPSLTQTLSKIEALKQNNTTAVALNIFERGNK
jgi:NADH-quinone oxidoreductase subunit M